MNRGDGTFGGYNTDCIAALDSIERGLGCPVAGKTVVVLGAGGAGRAVAYGAARRGARVFICNRTSDRAKALAADVGGQVVSWESLQAGDVSADVLANTTTVGMQPHVASTPLPAVALHRFNLVWDAVYTPLETTLLREAKRSGCKTENGLAMFVGQAAAQFQLFTGCTADVPIIMQKTLLSSLRN